MDKPKASGCLHKYQYTGIWTLRHLWQRSCLDVSIKLFANLQTLVSNWFAFACLNFHAAGVTVCLTTKASDFLLAPPWLVHFRQPVLCWHLPDSAFLASFSSAICLNVASGDNILPAELPCCRLPKYWHTYIDSGPGDSLHLVTERERDRRLSLLLYSSLRIGKC